MKKTVKVVMLPKEKANSPIIKVCDTLRLTSEVKGDGGHQHLYLVSDEIVKEGDYYIVRNNVFHNTGGNTLGFKTPCKIIATTDASLQISEAVGTHPGGLREVPLPQIPESFIKAYVKAEGKIDGVQVEYEECQIDCTSEADCVCFKNRITRHNLTLTTRGDNTVIIHQAKTYSSQDMRHNLRSVIGLCKANPDFDLEKWIEENL